MKITLRRNLQNRAVFSLIFFVMILACYSTNAYSLTSCTGDIGGDTDVDGEDLAVFIQQYQANTCLSDCSVALTKFVDEFGRQDCVELLHKAAVVGPLSGAEISAYKITSLGQSLEGMTAVESDDMQTAGSFGLALSDAGDDDWIVVTATGGVDIDHNGDGILDLSPTANLGTLHALAKAGDWRSRNLRITPLTELAFRYVENLLNEVPPEDIPIRLGDIARNLIKEDIDGNGLIDWYDILAFDPASLLHPAKLTTSYDWLSSPNAEGYSILASLLGGDEGQMLTCMDDTYSYLMTRFPVPDSRYHSVKVTLSVFGAGSAASNAPADLAVDSTLAEPIPEDYMYLPSDDTSQITFTASADPDSHILSWSGCDSVSADLSQCTVSLKKSQSVVINFGRTDTQLGGVVHDLTNTSNFLYADSITVLIPDDMTDMIAEMAAANIDDFVVGDDNGGFLRRITAINQLSSTNYQLETVDATLEEVIQEGTGHLFKQMTNGDLEGYTPPTSTSLTAKTASSAFVGLDGASLQVAADPDDTTFIILLGQTDTNDDDIESKGSVTEEVELYNDGEGGTLTASGTISLDIALDTGFDYKLFDGLQSFKFIAILDAEQSVSLAANAELAKFDLLKKKIGTLRFSPIAFAIGPVPVWVTPTVDVFLFAEGKIEAEASFGITFEQNIQGGLLYNKNSGFSSHKSFTTDNTPKLPAVEISASLKGGLETSAALKIYDATGPAAPLEAYAKLKSSASTELIDGCSDVVVQFLAGAEAKFKWDMSGSSKIGQMLHLDQLEEETTVTIFNTEWPIKEWTLYDSCPDYVQGSYLLVEGVGIMSTIDEGYAGGLMTTLTVSNTGDETLYWNTSGVPAEVLVSPSSGELAPGEEELVQMSLATADLPAGRYLEDVKFFNMDYLGSTLPDEEFGNTSKTIDVTVNEIITDSPTITSATSLVSGKVALEWDFTPEGSTPFIGFLFYASRTPEIPESFQFVYMADYTSDNVLLAGIPAGETSFAMSALAGNGQTGPFSNIVTVNVAGDPAPVGTVYNPATGEVWMDRNLGASRVATSYNDPEAYGDLYQWGRGTDGHEKRNSGITSVLSSTDDPGHGNFITTSSYPYDWRSPQNDNLWQGESGINNPCPAGFRLPTITELETERFSWSSNDYYGAFGSPLKLVAAGYRNLFDGTVYGAVSIGYYWSSTVYTPGARNLAVYSVGATTYDGLSRAYGLSARCLED